MSTATSDETEILRAIAEIAAEKLSWKGEVRPEQRFVEDLELDSIRLLTLAVEVEDRFEICIEEADETAIRTVGDLVEVVARKLRA